MRGRLHRSPPHRCMAVRCRPASVCASSAGGRRRCCASGDRFLVDSPRHSPSCSRMYSFCTPGSDSRAHSAPLAFPAALSALRARQVDRFHRRVSRSLRSCSCVRYSGPACSANSSRCTADSTDTRHSARTGRQRLSATGRAGRLLRPAPDALAQDRAGVLALGIVLTAKKAGSPARDDLHPPAALFTDLALGVVLSTVSRICPASSRSCSVAALWIARAAQKASGCG